jgi:hypothetical protein
VFNCFVYKSFAVVALSVLFPYLQKRDEASRDTLRLRGLQAKLLPAQKVRRLQMPWLMYRWMTPLER